MLRVDFTLYWESGSIIESEMEALTEQLNRGYYQIEDIRLQHALTRSHRLGNSVMTDVRNTVL